MAAERLTDSKENSAETITLNYSIEGTSEFAARIPLVPKSRLSPQFRQHLKDLEEGISPGTFSAKLMEKLKKFKGNRSHLPASFDIAINSKDIEIAWDEAARLGKIKFNQNCADDWVSKHYYLMKLILTSKLTCLSSPCPEINRDNPVILDFIRRVENVIKCHQNMCEAMMRQTHLFSIGTKQSMGYDPALMTT